MTHARTPRESHTEMTEFVLPQHTNALGTVFGGQVMAWIDICAAITAQRHCGRIPVTAAVDELVFLAPIHLGDVVVLQGRLNEAFSSSMEVEVIVEVEEASTRARKRCLEALLTFVSVEDGKPCRVPTLVAEDDDDRARQQQAAERRRARLARRMNRGG